MADLDAIRASAHSSPSFSSALQSRPFPELSFETHEDFVAARAAHLQRLRHLMPEPWPAGPIPNTVQETSRHVPARDGYEIPVVHYAPANEQPSQDGPAPGKPLVILYHEGGWSSGDLSDEEFNARLLVRDLGVVCLNVDYRLAPQHRFPTWIHDSIDVVRWAVLNAATLGVDVTRGLIVGGSSAGGNIAGVLAMLSAHRMLDVQPDASETKTPQLPVSVTVTGQWLSVPYLIPIDHIPSRYKTDLISMSENTSDPVLGSMMESERQHLSDLTSGNLNSPLISVVAQEFYPPKSSKVRGAVPKAFLQCAGMDPLRDHALVYDRILREEFGGETKCLLYAGYPHMFWTNWPELPESARYARDLVQGFQWLLE